MAKKIKRPIRFIARKNADPVGTITEYNKAGLSKKTFPGTYGKKKSVTDIPTKTSPQKKILFTGLDKAEFKMGNKMIKVVRDAVKEHGKENVTLIHGGREKQSIIDKNIIELGKHTGVKVESDPLDFTQKNAKDVRLQRRIDDPDLEWHSFDRKGNLSLKDKHEGWARKTYESLKEEKTYKIGSSKKKSGLGIKYPDKKADSAGKSTQATSKFKSFLDILEDEPNQQKVKSGIKYARKVSKWSEEKFGRPLITEKNQQRLDYIEFGEGQPSGTKNYKAIEDFGEKTYVETDRDNPNTSGKPKITRIKKGSTSPFTGKDISGKPLSKTMKVTKRGTILTGKKDPAPPSHISPKYLDAPEPEFKGGPTRYSKSSSLTQFGDIEHAEPADHKEAQRKALQDPKYDSDVNVGDDKSSSGRGVERHKSTHLREQRVKEKLELREVKKFGPIFDSLHADFKKAKTGKERKAIDQRAKTILTRMSDMYDVDAAPETTAGGETIGKGRGQQSVTFTDVKSPSPHYERKVPKEARKKASLKKDRATPFVETKATAERGIPRRPLLSELSKLKSLDKQMSNIGKSKTTVKNKGRFLHPIHKRINKRAEAPSIKDFNKKLPRRPPVKGASAPLKALTPFILGGGALQMLPNEAFGERAASNMERANRRGGGGKKPFHLRKRDIPLTKLSAKKYRRYA